MPIPRFTRPNAGRAVFGSFSDLHNESLNDETPCFPDIEVVPNIVVDQDEAKSPKGYNLTTKSPLAGHK
jgi:hypothetical protein